MEDSKDISGCLRMQEEREPDSNRRRKREKEIERESEMDKVKEGERTDKIKRRIKKEKDRSDL